jgi:hypothetical protein
MAERPVGKRRATDDGGTGMPPADPGTPADATNPAEPRTPADAANPTAPGTPADQADPRSPTGATNPTDTETTTDAANPANPADPPTDRPSETHTALPPKVESWRKRSATGAILTGFALGLQQVFEPERKEPAIVQETSGEPPRDLPVEAELEGVVGRRSVVRIRPWLLDEEAVDAEEGVEPEDGMAAAPPPTAGESPTAALAESSTTGPGAGESPTAGLAESPTTGVTSHSRRTRARRARQARRMARRRR